MAKRHKESKNRQLEKTCLSIIKIGAYLTLFTPLVVHREAFFPFVSPKTIYFRILTEIILAAYLILAIHFPRYRPKLNIVGISILAFLFILILTSFLGINFERSFWSTYERMTGIFTFLHLLAFFIVLTNVFKEREDWEKILSVSILVGVFLCIYVLTKDQISTRGGGTIGNTSFMAAYLLFDVFFALALSFSKRPSFLKTFARISLLFLIPTLLMSTARGAIFSFWAGIGLLIMGYLIFSKTKNLQKIGILIIVFLIGLSLISAIYQPSFVKNQINRLLKEMKPRFVVWEKGWKGFLERPIFGWGPENFNVLFTKFFNPCVFLSVCGGEIWFDRVHNIVFDTLVSTGAVGLFVYLLMFAVSVFGLLKICKKKKEGISIPLIIAVLLVVYFFQNLLVFDMISSYLVFFLSLSFTSFLIDDEKELYLDSGERPVSLVLSKKSVKNIILVIVILVSTSFIYFGNIQPFSSAAYTVKMVVEASTPQQGLDYFQKALNTLMEKYEIREQFAQKNYQISFSSQVDKQELSLALSEAEKEMEKSIAKNKLDFRPHLFLGRLYFSSYRISGQREKLDLAEKTFKQAIELSPTNQQGYWHLAEVKMAKSQYQEGYELFQKAIDLEPRLGRAYWFLATAYKMTGQNTKALEQFKKADEFGYDWQHNVSDIELIAEIYRSLGDYSSLLSLYQQAVKTNPNNAELWANLAATYADLGQFQQAKEAAQKVIEINPDLAPRVEEFLRALEQ